MQPQTSSPFATPPAPLAVPSDAAREFEEFVYLISHDVRSSVRALIELPQWIVEDLEEAGVPITGSVASSIEMMNRHTGRLDRMLVDLLTYSRIGRMQNVVRNDLGLTLDQVLEEVKVPSDFVLVRDLVVDQLTLGERDVLTLFGALIQNAVRHHDKSSGRIIISTTQEGAHFVLRVADDGPGVAEKFRERVFGVMQTLRPRDEVEGSGLGLSNVRKIAEVYGGHASIGASPFGRGACVEVRIHQPPS